MAGKGDRYRRLSTSRKKRIRAHGNRYRLRFGINAAIGHLLGVLITLIVFL